MLDNLAELCRARGKYAKAELFDERSLATGEKGLGPGHANVAVRLRNLAGFYSAQGRHAAGEVPRTARNGVARCPGRALTTRHDSHETEGVPDALKLWPPGRSRTSTGLPPADFESFAGDLNLLLFM